MRYVTVFDAAAEPLRNWWFPAYGLIFVAMGLLLAFKPEALNARVVQRAGFRWFVLIFAVGWTLACGLAIGLDSYKASRALRTGDYKVVEGRVENFAPMPWAGHGDETFDVNGVHFAYSDYTVTAGFNNTASHGGPIRAGLPVRISYKGDGEILRLEVAR
jgi:hypothetical protein